MDDVLSGASVDPSVDFPRDLYLNAEDIKKTKPGTHENDLAVIRNHRFGFFRNVNSKSEDLTTAVKALKAFDKTGNVGSALDHVECTFRDLKVAVAELIEDIEAAETRYQAAGIVWPKPDEPAQPNAVTVVLTSGPKPAPPRPATLEELHSAFERAAAEGKQVRS